MTVGALVCPALALVGYLATEVSRREFNRLVLIGPPDAASRDWQARQLAETFGAAMDGGVLDAATPDRAEAALASSAGALGPGLVALVTTLDGSFVAAHPTGRARVVERGPHGALVVENAAKSGPRDSRWRLQVHDGGAVVRDRTGLSVARLHVLEEPDARVRREAEFTMSVTGGVVVAVLIAGVLAMGVAAGLARRIVRPVEELSTLARRFGAGDLTVRSRETGADEIGHLARSFNEMADRLVQAEKVRRSMLSDVAHELRTPLTNVRCQLEAVQDGLLPATAETLGSLNEEILSLMQLIDDLQDLALADAGRLHLHIEPCDIAAELRSLVRASGRPEGPLIDVDTPPSVVARVDPKRLRQIVRNLLANAVAAVSPTGHVTVSAAACGERVDIQVADDGPGVPAEHLTLVFDRYYRVADRDGRSGGTGLGLAIVKRLVELHGGTVTAATRPEGGMVFSLTFPGAGVPTGP